MGEKYEPCSICEAYIKDVACDNNNCPVAKMKAEIERLKKILESYALQYGTVVDKERILKQAKSEAIKEFAKSIKSYIDAYVVFEYAAGEQNLLNYIDNLVQEMEGESK